MRPYPKSKCTPAVGWLAALDPALLFLLRPAFLLKDFVQRCFFFLSLFLLIGDWN